MARRLYMARTRSLVWSISFWSTSSEDWKSGAVTEIRTWEPPTIWGSGRHGSKPAPEMIRLKLWSLRISGSVRAASLALTETCRRTPFDSRGVDSTSGAPVLPALALMGFAAGHYQVCFSALAAHRYPV